MHLGNLRTALLAWLQARLMDGVFVLRLEDLDTGRNQPGCASRMLDDLRRLGLDWDEGPDLGGPLGPYTQLERATLYGAALERLRELGWLFPCYCSRQDIREAASAPHGGAPVYPGTCRRRAAPPVGARPPAWRFRVGDACCAFHDCLQGMHYQHLGREVGDFVVQRRDSVVAYQLAVVVDDAAMGVTDVLRGADLLDSTPRQLALQAALGLPTPRYWHVPLLCDADGERLSKRNTAACLADYCAAGGTPQSLVGRFAHELGLHDRAEPMSALELLKGLTMTGLLRLRLD